MLYPQWEWRTMNVARRKPRQRTPTEEAAMFDLPFWGPLAPVVIVVVNALDWLGVW